ncbi:hypothetical protein [Burkholderia sp. Bp9143]|uniref:hypothetical protein n=1 Tax=Burkholderia sp. Bp9143 TaxID=2184574 RepID=UPI000F5A5DC4|nr:hypothetical protein [Burkholderia sp. Bp9143]
MVQCKSAIVVLVEVISLKCFYITLPCIRHCVPLSMKPAARMDRRTRAIDPPLPATPAKRKEIVMLAKPEAGLSTAAIEWPVSQCGGTVTGLLQKINATARVVFDI